MTIAQNIHLIRQTVAAAAARAGRDPAAVTLIAVSKTWPAEAVVEAAAAGVQHFGENRVEEAEVKIPAVSARVSDPLTWHMIGHVQSRKAKDVAPLFHVIHSVDTVKLAQKFSTLGVERQQPVEVLLEVNVSGESAKHGFNGAGWASDPAVRTALWADVQQIAALPGLRLRGLMTMAPIVPDAEQARPVFSSLAALRAALQDAFQVALPDLSMGMTDDYPVAVEEGATLIRVGRAIFGER